MTDAMAQQDLLSELREAIGERLPGLEHGDSGLEVAIDTRFGRQLFVFDYDAQAGSIRIYTAVPPPPGTGPAFLTWCLTMNTVYWDVKMGLSGDGVLLVLSDVDLDPGAVSATADLLLARVASMCELIDDDLVEYLVEEGLGTPTQRARWRRR